MTKPIQEHIGERAIEAFVDFARLDIPTVAELEAGAFKHIYDPKLRTACSQVFYGSRWIYKLGLVTLARNEERAAHVRAQIVDYASICEALLSFCVGHALQKSLSRGTAHNFVNPDETNPSKRRQINWSRGSVETTLRKQSFWWQARVCREFGVISPPLCADLDWLREERNAVHVRQRVALGATAYLQESKRAFGVLLKTMGRTRHWLTAHP